MVETINTTKYTIENDLTKKEKNKHTNKWHVIIYNRLIRNNKQDM